MRNVIGSIIVGIVAAIMSVSAMAAGAAPTLPEKKQTTLGLYMSAKEAFEAKQANSGKVLLIDIRTPEEYEFVGHPALADANIPFLKKDYSSWDDKKNVYVGVVNKNFEAAVERLVTASKLDKNATIVLMCRSGDRSALAANALAKAGFTQVYSLWEGFEGDAAKGGESDGKRVVNGWKNAGLPWTYAMEKGKAYLE